jgi:ABC-type glycerol-3-phosphate transport system substrate-binding protein
MKRTLAALTLLLALTGCRNAADPGAIRFRFWGDVEEVKIIEGLIRDFEAAHPGIKVKAT